ncbi:helix-turn-helix transcriptional regulator [Halobacillus kuroshimensis]|uniref:Helix-turn-helix transcriptional regulator n=1 Tax=Halobacillus kuroshimensis TaxID=302481 RepID=A0ABS3DZS1_9BACI|nr:helix-turn-helix transcriptional regulator [Halobacillus kuroshimensis]MBN8236861.1 helix-turn-helix transcriptional regulator [Halobacillus kuroshimensis]
MKEKHIRKKLIEKRKELGSQAKVAKELDISRQFLGAIENGERNPTVKLMVKMANLFNSSPNALFPDLFFEEESNKKLQKKGGNAI